MKVCAVVVTFNRLELLKLTLGKLFAQNVKLNEIIVVNNASTDGTKEYLKSIEDLITNVELTSNLGGAGGFYEGIKAALKNDNDYIWIMDDDTITKSDSLEKLLEGYEQLESREIGFLCSNVLFKDEKPCVMNIPHIYEGEWNEFANKGIIRLSATSFVSVLINRKAVERIGLPIKEFFIWGDDIEYTKRISNLFECYLIGDSVVYHYMNENKGVNIIDEAPERVNRYFYDIRNKFYVAKKNGFKAVIRYIVNTIKLSLNILIYGKGGKMKKIVVISKGFIKGIFFNPSIEYIYKR